MKFDGLHDVEIKQQNEELDLDLVTLSLLKAPTTCMEILTDKLSTNDTIVEDPQSQNQSDITDALN